MKKYIAVSLKLTLLMIILCAVLYPLLIAAVGKLSPGQGKGVTLSANGKIVGYENIGQQFTDDKYFWGRPSAVEFNAAAGLISGSNPLPLAVTMSAGISSFVTLGLCARKLSILSCTIFK